jgi:uncharacterized protein (TIGR03435 family)
MRLRSIGAKTFDKRLPTCNDESRERHHPKGCSMKSTLLLAAFILSSAAMAQAPAPALTFDVASIHPTKPGTLNGYIKGLPGGHGYTAVNITVKVMISLMYKVPMRQIQGGPGWLNEDRYDVEARVDGAYSLDDLHTMYQNLLADRFHLKLHREVHEGNVYALTVDPSGLKMKPNTSAQDYEIPMQGPPDHTVGKRVPMNYLCWYISQALQNDARPCVDLTGLHGNYDFNLSFMPLLPPGASADSLPPEYKDLPDIFTALKEQLGLRLTPQKGPVEDLIIDHIDKPTEN